MTSHKDFLNGRKNKFSLIISSFLILPKFHFFSVENIWFWRHYWWFYYISETVFRSQKLMMWKIEKLTRVCAILMTNVYHLNILSRAELMKGFEDSEDLFELVKWRWSSLSPERFDLFSLTTKIFTLVYHSLVRPAEQNNDYPSGNSYTIKHLISAKIKQSIKPVVSTDHLKKTLEYYST